MRRLMAMALVTAVVLAATAISQAAGGTASVEGTWKMTAVSIKGMEIPIPEGKGPTFKFTKDGKVTVDAGGGKTEEGTYKLVDKTGIDITISKGGKSETLMAIYEVTKDTLKLGMAGFGPDASKLPRPKAFDGDTTVMVLKKQ